MCAISLSIPGAVYAAEIFLDFVKLKPKREPGGRCEVLCLPSQVLRQRLEPILAAPTL